MLHASRFRAWCYTSERSGTVEPRGATPHKSTIRMYRQKSQLFLCSVWIIHKFRHDVKKIRKILYLIEWQRLNRAILLQSEEYLSVVRKKAADVEAHTRISAILGNGTKKQIKALGEYGRLLGMLLILNDDMADMLDFDELSHRLKNEHPPLQVIYALEKDGNKKEIEFILRKKQKTKNDVKRIMSITKRSEIIMGITEIMKKLADEAISQLENIPKNKFELQLLVEVLIP